MKMESRIVSSTRNQRGVVLFISLIFLLVMTFVGLYIFRSSVLQLQMADSAGSKTISFQQSESARAYAETLINALANSMSAGTAFNCVTKGYYARSTLAIDGCSALSPDSVTWDNTDSFSVPNSSDQRYTIEYRGIDEALEPHAGVDEGSGTDPSQMIDVYVFRILAKGIESAGGDTVLQTIFIARKSS